MKEGKEGSEKEDTERQGVEDAWKEGRRRKEEDSGSLERKEKKRIH